MPSVVGDLFGLISRNQNTWLIYCVLSVFFITLIECTKIKTTKHLKSNYFHYFRLNNLFYPLNSFDMASSDTTPGTGDHSNYSTVSASEPKRKVSILADPPAHNAGGYDNLGYVGTGRKISQVRIKIKWWLGVFISHVTFCVQKIWKIPFAELLWVYFYF